MKRILPLLTVLVLTLAFAVPAQAQTTPHFKFMGIPINGTISNFQSKLAAKGFVYDAKASKQSGPGIRRFTGMFSSNKAKLAVYYDTKTKDVYEVKVIIDCSDKDEAQSLYREMRSNLMTKYAGRSESEDTQLEGEDCTKVCVFHDDQSIGLIGVYVEKGDYFDYWVSFEYIDLVNANKHNESKMEDL